MIIRIWDQKLPTARVPTVWRERIDRQRDLRSFKPRQSDCAQQVRVRGHSGDTEYQGSPLPPEANYSCLPAVYLPKLVLIPFASFTAERVTRVRYC